MHTRMTSDAWAFNCAIVLGFITVASTMGTLMLAILGQPLSEVIIGLGVLAAAGLARLLISPLNQRWPE